MANLGEVFEDVRLEVFPDQGPYLEIDEELSRVDALSQYCYSPYWNQRLVFIEGITAVVRESSTVEIRQQIIPLVCELLQDDVPEVKIAVLNQIAEIGKFLVARNGSNGCWEIENLLPPVANLVRDENEQVSHTALSALADVWSLVEPTKRIQLACLVVEDLTLDNQASARIAACKLLIQISAEMEETNIQLCGKYVLLLAQDKEAIVRQESIGSLVALVSFSSIRGSIVDQFMKVCKDSIWSVRQACAAALQHIAPYHNNQPKLAQAMYALANDQSKWVRLSLLQNLMPVVAEISPKHRGQEWINLFISLISTKVPPTQQESLEYSWAYQLPAVIHIAGRCVWPQLQPHHSRLALQGTPKARHSIASSLPTLRSLLVGSTQVPDQLPEGWFDQNDLSDQTIQQQLVPLMEKLCVGEDANVRMQAMFGAADWLAGFELQEDKINFIKVLQRVIERKEGQINCREWRVALVLSQQISNILHHVDPNSEEAKKLITCFTTHPVAAVRSEAEKQLRQIDVSSE